MRRLTTPCPETEDNCMPLFLSDQEGSCGSVQSTPVQAKSDTTRSNRITKSKLVNLTPLDVPNDSSRVLTSPLDGTPRSLATPPLKNSGPRIMRDALVDSILSRPGW